MKMQTLAFAALSMMLSMCNGHFSDSQFSLQDIEPKVYCGRALSTALSLLCYGKLKDEEKWNEKRVMGNPMYNTILSQYYKVQKEQKEQKVPKDQEPQLGWPWVPPHRARTMSGSLRNKRYVVNECCDKACSITELMTYCD